MLQNLRNMNADKAPRPGFVLPCVLKCCTNELSKMQCICENFNSSLQECALLAVWKMSSIIHVPKEQNISTMKKLRPVALTSCVMKDGAVPS